MRCNMEQQLAERLAQQQADLDEQLAFVQARLPADWLAGAVRALAVCMLCSLLAACLRALQQMPWPEGVARMAAPRRQSCSRRSSSASTPRPSMLTC
jgi:hypothetical protein